MKGKWLIIGYSLGLLILLNGCGGVKKTTIPRYKFEVGKTLLYKAKCNMKLVLNAGLLKYNGILDLKADILVTAVETNKWGYKIRMEFKNPEINGADKQLESFVYLGLNAVKNWFPVFCISDRGKTAVSIEGKQITGFNSLLFPEFSDMDGIWKGLSETTNFNTKLQDQDLTVVYNKDWSILNSYSKGLKITNQIKLSTFNKDDLEKTTEPLPVGVFNMNYIDDFNVLKGKLIKKEGNLKMDFNISLNQGFLVYNLIIQGDGTFVIDLVEKAS